MMKNHGPIKDTDWRLWMCDPETGHESLLSWGPYDEAVAAMDDYYGRDCDIWIVNRDGNKIHPGQVESKTFNVEWKCHFPRLMKEIMDCNPTAGVLYVPVNLMMGMISRVASRAAKLNDPIMNDLMCKLTLYESADPSSKEYDPEMMKIVEDMDKAQVVKEKAKKEGPTFTVKAINETINALKNDSAGNEPATMTDLDFAVKMLQELITMKETP